MGDVAIENRSDESAIQVKENHQAFTAVLPDLLKDHAGEFALMKDGIIIEFFDTASDAKKAGSCIFPGSTFSTEEVVSARVELIDLVAPPGAITPAGGKGRQLHPELRVELVDVDDEHVTLALDGMITHETTQRLRKELLCLWEENGGGNLTLQFSKVKVIDSDGIGTLCILTKKIAESGHRVCLLHPSKIISNLLKTMKLEQIMEIK